MREQKQYSVWILSCQRSCQCEFEVNVGMHQGSVLSSFVFAVVVDVITGFSRGCAM